MRILISKILPPEQLALIESWGWEYDFIPALEITPVDVGGIPADSPVWIVSSRNSLHVVEKFRRLAPPLVLVVGEWMSGRLSSLLTDSEIRSFPNMKSLASHVYQHEYLQVLYFCADYHREDLEVGLRGSGIKVSKVITHQSKPTNPKLSESYDVVLAFSPRSVNSLLEYNDFDKTVLFACIGPTTEQYLHQLNYTYTFCASSPDSDILLNELRTYLMLSNV